MLRCSLGRGTVPTPGWVPSTSLDAWVRWTCSWNLLGEQIPPSLFRFSLQALRPSFSKDKTIADLGGEGGWPVVPMASMPSSLSGCRWTRSRGWVGQPSALCPLLEGKQTFGSGVRVSKDLMLQATALLIFPLWRSQRLAGSLWVSKDEQTQYCADVWLGDWSLRRLIHRLCSDVERSLFCQLGIS